MPNRIIKESICVSEDIDKLSWFEEVLFYRLIVNCDDFGRFDGRPVVIKSRLFPLKCELSLTDVCNGIQMLSSVGLIELYRAGDKEYIQISKWLNHQTRRANKSKYPDPEEYLQASEISCNQMYANVHVFENENDIRIRNSETRTGTETGTRTQKKFSPPTVEEVRAYCLERGNKIEAETFVDFYASKGWKVGKEPMKDWKACIRTWERRHAEEDKQQKGGWTFSDL